MSTANLLDGNVDEVKAGLAGLVRADLQALLEAEQAGKKRKGVIDAINEAIAALPADDAGENGNTSEDESLLATADDADAQQGDNGAAPATDFEASGAPHQIVADVIPSHPAVDADPRANTTEEQNRIDFNDPSLSGAEAVERNLRGA